ncbi:MAG: hypothetical protein IPO88_04040 [Nannocystis sp.]|uniref:hypothetical protein n=1 Tax=Nannocystis sp. TaxID=1962667 RepID=UPI0024239AEB|nr:hypothetical protein [Nannocystis sp.]MBK9752672.1 hypothetical protein [Nannocystis sp.]
MPLRSSYLIAALATLPLLACAKDPGGTDTDAQTTGGDTSMNPETDTAPTSTDAGAPIPLIECDGDPPPPAIMIDPVACSVEPGVWCDSCPSAEQWTIQCERSVFPVAGITAAGEARVVVDPATSGMAPLLIELSPVPVTTAQPGLFGHAMAVDDADAAHLLFPHEVDGYRLLHREAGLDTQIACIDNAVWVNFGFVAHKDTLTALVAWLQDGPAGLALAVRDGGGTWSIEDLGLPMLAGSLAVADDGTRLVAYAASSPEGATPRVRVGDSDQDPGFAGSNMVAVPTLVPGPTTYLAATFLGPTGIEVGIPGPKVTVLPDTPPLPQDGCDAFNHPTCSGSCQISAHGLSRDPIALRDGSDIVLAYIDVIRDIDGHFEGDPCNGGRGPGCNCEYVVDTDQSSLEFVLLRVDLPALTASEASRTTLPIANARLHAAQHGDHVVLAFTADTAIHVATLDLTALP